MTPERWQQIETLFHAALERPPSERAAWLPQACANDQTLRTEVEKLLVSYDAAGNFLDEPLAESLGWAKDSPQLEKGQRLAHYEIVAPLGKGGMGEVYLATDTHLLRPIALKLLAPELMHDAQFVRRFEAEARAASALNHPNIITVHDIGEATGAHFIATEFIEGETLRARLNRAPLTTTETLALVTQITEALVAAHTAGIIHRDIKPENVMIRPDGLVKVLDFGLAKLTDRDTGRLIPHSALCTPHSTDPHVLLGTLAYLSPEQARRDQLDARTDLFSLGVVLYEMLTGARPFSGANEAATLDAIQHQSPAPFASLRADLPAGLEQIVARALAKDPATRYQTATEFRAALTRLEQTRPNATALNQRTRYVMAAALALTIAFGLWLWQARRAQPIARPAFNSAAPQKLTDMPGQELYPSLAPDGQSVVFASRHNGNLDIYRQAAGARTAINLTEGSESIELQPAYSPDGKQIAFRSSRNDGGIFVMNSDGSQVAQLTDTGFNPCWSPDGREIALADDIIWDYEGRNTYPSASRLWAVNVQTRQRRVITEHDAVQPNWSPHGQRLAFWGEQRGGHRDIWTVAASGGELTPVTDDAFIDWNPVWSPTGEHLYFLSNRGGEMNLWRVAIDESTGQLHGAPEPATLPSNNCQYVNFARNGSALVYGQSTRSENLWQIAFDPVKGETSGAATPLTQGLKRYAMFSLAPDEQSFAYLARGEPQQDLFIADRAGAPRQRLTDDAAQDIIPRWSPDGRWIAFLSDRSGKYEIWKVRPDGTGLAQMTHEPGEAKDVIAPVWSPDSRKLLYQIRNVNSYVIDAERPGAEQTSQPLPGQPVPGFLPWEWSPDGAYLAGWQPPLLAQQQRGIVIYSVAQQRYQRLTDLGSNPSWLNDNRRLLCKQGGNLYLLDRLDGKLKQIYAVKLPNQIGSHAVSRDNQRLYFSEVSSEADIWLLKLD